MYSREVKKSLKNLFQSSQFTYKKSIQRNWIENT